MDIKVMHTVSVVRIYDINDELDVEVVTSAPYVFGIKFYSPKEISGFRIEPMEVPIDKSLR